MVVGQHAIDDLFDDAMGAAMINGTGAAQLSLKPIEYGHHVLLHYQEANHSRIKFQQ